MDEKQKQDFSIFIEAVKLKLASFLIKDVHNTFTMINKKVFSFLTDNENITQAMFELNIGFIEQSSKISVASDLEKHFIKAIDKAKDIDSVFFDKKKTNTKLTGQDFRYASTRSVQQASIIVDNLLVYYKEEFSKVDQIYAKLKTAQSFDELQSFIEYKNLSMKHKNLLKRSFDMIQGSYIDRLNYERAKNISLKYIKEDLFQTNINTNIRSRAGRVAYNEISGTVERTRMIRAIATGKQKKSWNAILDTSTRNTHAKADNQVVGIDEYFIVLNPQTRTPERLKHPGDTLHGASISNTINCRCTVIYL